MACARSGDPDKGEEGNTRRHGAACVAYHMIVLAIEVDAETFNLGGDVWNGAARKYCAPKY